MTETGKGLSYWGGRMIQGCKAAAAELMAKHSLTSETNRFCQGIRPLLA